jgi:phage-related protein
MTTHEDRTQFTDPQYSDPQNPGAQYSATQQSDQQYSDQQYASPQQTGLQQNDSPFDDTPRGTEAPPQPAETAPPAGHPGMAQPSSEHDRPQADSTEADSELSLFGETEMSGFRARWNDVQAGFVDDPKQCVQTADALVSEVVDQLTTGFSEARARMEAQWARGEDASTEDLRVALKRYREFFQRLLSV